MLHNCNMNKVLVVEDEEPVRRILAEKLAKEKLLVLQAVDGVEGIKLALEQKPDVILLDIRMPHVDGLEVLDKVREDSWGKNVPIFMLTNLTESSQISRAMGKNVKGYIVKSDWKLDDVVTEVKKVLH